MENFTSFFPRFGKLADEEACDFVVGEHVVVASSLFKGFDDIGLRDIGVYALVFGGDVRHIGGGDGGALRAASRAGRDDVDKVAAVGVFGKIIPVGGGDANDIRISGWIHGPAGIFVADGGEDECAFGGSIVHGVFEKGAGRFGSPAETDGAVAVLHSVGHGVHEGEGVGGAVVSEGFDGHNGHAFANRAVIGIEQAGGELRHEGPVPDFIGGERRIRVGGIEGAKNGGAQIFICQQAGIENGDGYRSITLRRFPWKQVGCGRLFSGKEIGKVDHIVGFGERDGFIAFEFVEQREDVGAFGEKDAIDAEIGIGGDDGSAKTGQKRFEIGEGGFGAKANQYFAGHKAEPSVQRRLNAPGALQPFYGTGLSFAKDADSSETGHWAERPGVALPIQAVVVGRQRDPKDLFHIPIAPGTGNCFLNSGIDFHLHASAGKVFEQAGKRLVLDTKPNAILIQSEFMYFRLREQRRNPASEKKRSKNSGHGKTVAGLSRNGNQRAQTGSLTALGFRAYNSPVMKKLLPRISVLLLVWIGGACSVAADDLDAALEAQKKAAKRRVYSETARIEDLNFVIPKTQSEEETALDRELERLERQLGGQGLAPREVITPRMNVPVPAPVKKKNWLTPDQLDPEKEEALSSKTEKPDWVELEMERQRALQLQKEALEKEEALVNKMLREDSRDIYSTEKLKPSTYEPFLRNTITPSVVPVTASPALDPLASLQKKKEESSSKSPLTFSPSTRANSGVIQSPSELRAADRTPSPSWSTPAPNSTPPHITLERNVVAPLTPLQRVRKSNPIHRKDPFEEDFMPEIKTSIWD